MKVLLVGSEGSIGKRYQYVIRWLGHEVLRNDVAYKQSYTGTDFDCVVIATPTPTHRKTILEYAKYKKPILCEKPMLENTDYSDIEHVDRLYMVCNYKYVIPKGAHIYYNYFHGGNESFQYNFAQPLYIDPNAKIELQSPVYQLRYTFQGNTVSVSTEELQQSYVTMMKDFIDGKFENLWNVDDAKKMSQILQSYE
ncbi:MAG: Gfo/Idh/MocA family oxidoreductase [Bdellovibrionales bacterium]|nr:Gfo/Idh/MocA family oxidoreductase [Bdellovibrionales bacterium]